MLKAVIGLHGVYIEMFLFAWQLPCLADPTILFLWEIKIRIYIMW